MMATLENKIRGQAGLVAEAMLVGPSDATEASEAEDAPPMDEGDAPKAKGRKAASQG